jgi:mono/diheme cytochrome c family protein
MFALVLLAGCALLASHAYASDGNPGRAAYFEYCSRCHGADGRGNGEAAHNMRPKASDLTQLAKKHGGTFPAAQVAAIIDGRRPLAAHGSSKMPVWGRAFAEEKTAEDPEAHARSQIQIVVDYLRSIQTN